ncbi:hypothetical protein AB0O87_06965 [Microbacterium sp. NPDC076768]|uniref:hypothetical protein n=1 Tax=Microbacterium sp. NPDC076768 TaxID=3154858 RepID=UPI003442BB35
MASATLPRQRNRATSSRASATPLIVGLAAVVISIGLAVFVVLFASNPVSVFFDVPMPLVIAEFWWLSMLGYILTPVIVVACYGWDRIAQRKGQRENSNFVDREGYTKILLGAAAFAILLAVWHVLNLSVPLTELWGLA